MPAKKKQAPIEPFLNPLKPEQVPNNFTHASAINLEAKRAINYWKDQKRYAMITSRKLFADEKLKAWQAVSEKAEAIMQSHQLKLF